MDKQEIHKAIRFVINGSKREELFFLKSLTEVTVDIAIIRIYDRVRQLQKEIGEEKQDDTL